MGDLELFRVGNGAATEIAGTAITVENTLQNLIERNLETSLDVREATDREKLRGELSD